MGDGKYKGVIPKAIGEIFDYIEKVLYSVFNLPTIPWIFKKMLWSNRFLSNVVSIHFLFKQLRVSGWCAYWEMQTKLFFINKIPVTVAYWIWLWNWSK